MVAALNIAGQSYGRLTAIARSGTDPHGKALWQFKVASGIVGQPTTYKGPDGKQYVAVTTGLGGGSPQAKPGTMLREVRRPAHGYMLYVFALPDAN